MQISALAACLFLVSGCATYQANPRLEEAQDLYALGRNKLSKADRSDELLFVLTFSGGGTRAAAMSYGILEALEKVEIPQQRKQIGSGTSGHSLLDEVDIISSVSGGSFTAAYYGLHGKKAFEDYPERFLYKNVQSALMWRVFNPFIWPRLMSPGYNRSNMAADYYDNILFDGKSMENIFQSDGPAILIQATDIIEGHIFSFTPYFFNLICSDLAQFRVSLAVTASSSFPGAFSSISLTNYGGQCGYEPEPWVYEALKRKKTVDPQHYFAKRELRYTNSEEKKFIHLYDGGVGDNLGLEGPLINLSQYVERGVDPKKIGLGKTKRVVFIIVNAQTNKTSDRRYFNMIQKPPSTRRTLAATVATLMNSSNFDTIYMFQKFMEERFLKMQLAGEDMSELGYDIIHIAFEEITDDDERKFFENLPTTLKLPADTVDRVRKKAGELLYQSKEFQELIADLGGEIPE